MGRILPDGFIASSGFMPTNGSTPTNGSMKMFWRFLASEPGVTAIKDCLIVQASRLRPSRSWTGSALSSRGSILRWISASAHLEGEPFHLDNAACVIVFAIGMQARYSLSPPSPEGGRLHLIDFPIEKIIIARPRMDLAPANLTSEISGLLVSMLLPCRGVRHPAIGTAKIFDRPGIACHSAIMRRTERVFQPRTLPQSMTSYFNLKIRRPSDSVFLTSPFF
jgi:hypothetical protein